VTSLPPIDSRAVDAFSPATAKSGEGADFQSQLQRPHVPPASRHGHAHGHEPMPEEVSAASSPKPDPAHQHDAIAPLDQPSSLAGLSARIYPQSLRVIGYLSMLGAGDARAVAQGTAAATSWPPPAQASSASDLCAPSPVLPEAAFRDVAETGAGAQAAIAAPAPVPEHGDIAIEAVAGGDTPGPAAEWARRLVRFEGGTATLWIRDFRLDPAQRQALAAQLREHARGMGRTVDRVMVNGEEIWRDGARTEYQARREPYGH
jgi:hypothetical protein